MKWRIFLLTWTSFELGKAFTTMTASNSPSAPGRQAADSALPADSVAIERAVQILSAGGLVSFPTETVYGLGADAENDQAVQRVFSAKGRPPHHPLILHVASAAMIERYATAIPDTAWKIVERFWPGPLTLILKRNTNVSDLVTGGQDTVGLRVPSHPVAQALLAAFGRAVAAPSANRFGRISPTSAAHVIKELEGRVDQVLDGGSCTVGLESTILDLSSARPRLLRPGAISREMLADVLGEFPTAAGVDTPRVPGQLPSHYAPRTPMQLVSGAALAEITQNQVATGNIAVMAIQPPPNTTRARWLVMPAEPRDYARLLYANLRNIDEEGHDGLFVERPPLTPEWEAVRDRLERAAGGIPQQDQGLN